MNVLNAEVLRVHKCSAFEGVVPRYTTLQAREQLEEFQNWKLSNDGDRIYRKWVFSDFCSAFKFMSKVARLAEDEQHHLDLDLVQYRSFSVESYTHAIHGSSENDFILASKIDAIVSG